MESFIFLEFFKMLKFWGIFLGFFGGYLCFLFKNGDLARPSAQVYPKNGEKVDACVKSICLQRNTITYC